MGEPTGEEGDVRVVEDVGESGKLLVARVKPMISLCAANGKDARHIAAAFRSSSVGSSGLLFEARSSFKSILMLHDFDGL